MVGAPVAKACPGALFAGEFSPVLQGPRAGLRLFTKAGPASVGWRTIPLQVDPVDSDGMLIFFDDAAYLGKNIAQTDYLTFRPEDFGKAFTPGRDHLPCQGAVVYELKDEARGSYGYLTNCGPLAPQALSRPPAVAFDRTHNLLESAFYRYRFNSDNYMQFDSISFKNLQNAWDLIAKDSRLLIRADVKNFFTMSFDSRQIESHLEASRMGPVGDLARLSFYLRIFVFKIQMSLSTDVGFYADSGHIPMMVNIPIDAFNYLHPASGILYSWVLSPLAQAGKTDIHMPRLDVGLVKKGAKELAKAGLTYCNGADCLFRYTVDVRGRRLSMVLGVKRDLVAKGFFPLYVDDVSHSREAMGWDPDATPGSRHGMYFEVSGLPSGGHPWDFWLKLGPQTGDTSVCPTPVRIARLDTRSPNKRTPAR